MLQSVHVEGIDTHEEAKAYVGKTFRIKFVDQFPLINDEQICELLLQ